MHAERWIFRAVCSMCCVIHQRRFLFSSMISASIILSSSLPPLLLLPEEVLDDDEPRRGVVLTEMTRPCTCTSSNCKTGSDFPSPVATTRAIPGCCCNPTVVAPPPTAVTGRANSTRTCVCPFTELELDACEKGVPTVTDVPPSARATVSSALKQAWACCKTASTVVCSAKRLFDMSRVTIERR